MFENKGQFEDQHTHSVASKIHATVVGWLGGFTDDIKSGRGVKKGREGRGGGRGTNRKRGKRGELRVSGEIV